MRRCIPLLVWLVCSRVAAQGPPAAPATLVLDAGGHTSDVGVVLFTPDGRELISVSKDKSIRIWDVASGKPLRVFRPPIGPGHEGELYAAALSPDGRTLAVGGYGPDGERGSIYLIATTSGRVELVLKGHLGSISSLAFVALPGGPLVLASGSDDRTARIWNVETGECWREFKDHTDGITGLAWSPDGWLATVSFDRTVRIWTANTVQTLRDHTGGVMCVAWSPDGDFLATGSLDRSIRLWKRDGSLARTIADRDGCVMSVRFTADSKELLYTWGEAERKSGAAILAVSSGEERIRFARHDGIVRSGAISPDGAVAATAGWSGDGISLWKTTDATLLNHLNGRGRPNWAAGWSPDGQSIAWGHTRKEGDEDNNRGPLERTFSLRDLELGPAPGGTYRRTRDSLGIISLKRMDLGNLIVQQGHYKVERIVSPTGEVIRSFTCVPGNLIAVGGEYDLYLYNAHTGARRDLRAHTGAIRALAPSPDERFLLSASEDQTLRIWRLGREEPMLSLFFAGDDWIAWTPEGYYAASPGGENLMGWQLSRGPKQAGTFAPASQFHSALYRPDVIKRVLQAGGVAEALEQLKTSGATVHTVAEVLPPTVVITNPDPSRPRLSQPELTVRAKAVAQPGHPITALRLLLDERPYEGEKGRKDVAVNPAGSSERTESWVVRLDPGRHRLAVVAESDVSNGRSESVEVVYEEQRSARPRLYALLVGVSDYEDKSLRLSYAAADAELLERTLKEKAAKAFDGVAVRRLVDREATRAAFYDGLQWLKESVKPQDVGIIFFSGHGHLDDDGVFYMLPAEVKLGGIAASALDGTLFKRKLAGIKGKVVVMLDACHAAGAAKDAGAARGAAMVRPYADDFVREMVREDAGIVMMCSSTGREVSREDAALGHGYFTQALTEGLAGRADSNKDGLVYLTELDSYLFERVKDLSQDRQHAVTAKPAGVVPFVLTRP